MLPFLASSVHVVKQDGSTVDINSNEASDSSDGDNASTVTHTSTPAKHHSSSGDTGIEVVPIVAIVFVFLWLIVKALMAPFTQRAAYRRDRTPPDGAQVLSEEEQAVLVKFQRTIGQMERRIESLETILIDEHRTKEKYGNKI